jgi:hypothetical protein
VLNIAGDRAIVIPGQMIPCGMSGPGDDRGGRARRRPLCGPDRALTRGPDRALSAAVTVIAGRSERSGGAGMIGG